jgi:hypothetical protein
MRSPRLEEDGTHRIAKPKTLHANHLIAIAATSSRFHQDSGKREGCTYQSLIKVWLPEKLRKG